MKNILAENMLRFGVKNLSAKSKNKLAEQTELDEQTQEGVKSMLAIPGVKEGKTVSLSDADKTTRVITINTKADMPVPAGITLFGVMNDASAVVSRLGAYNLVIGNIGQYDTATKKFKSLSKLACFTLEDRMISQIPILDVYLKTENGIAQLFAKLCLTAKDNNMNDAGLLYTQQYNNLIRTFKFCTLTNTAPIPTEGDPKTDMKLAAFNKTVTTYISKGGKA